MGACVATDMIRSGLVLLTVLHVAPAAADTLGYLRVMTFDGDFAIAKPSGKPRLVVARTAAEWSTTWKQAGGSGTAPTVDFERDMVVGVVNGPKDDRVVYRIQLDDAANAKALEVHLGRGDAPSWSGNTRKPTGAHFVATPRTALPLHVVFDEMIDGMLFAHSTAGEGVDSKDVATIAAVAIAAAGKAALRENAERAVIDALTAAERKQLLVGPYGRRFTRIPHGWTKLAIERTQDRWTITYDELTFEVDVATAAVTRRGR